MADKTTTNHTTRALAADTWDDFARLVETNPENLFEEFGFQRDRRIAKWRWVMRLRVQP